MLLIGLVKTYTLQTQPAIWSCLVTGRIMCSGQFDKYSLDNGFHRSETRNILPNQSISPNCSNGSRTTAWLQNSRGNSGWIWTQKTSYEESWLLPKTASSKTISLHQLRGVCLLIYGYLCLWISFKTLRWWLTAKFHWKVTVIIIFRHFSLAITGFCLMWISFLWWLQESIPWTFLCFWTYLLEKKFLKKEKNKK